MIGMQKQALSGRLPQPRLPLSRLLSNAVRQISDWRISFIKPTAHTTEQGRVGHSLVRTFLWTGLSVTIAGVILASLLLQAAVDRGFERSAIERSTHDAAHVAHIFYYTVWAPVRERIPDIAFREAAHPVMMDTFARRSTYGMGIVSLKVWGVDGALIWSSDPTASVGAGGTHWHEPVVAHGQTVSRLHRGVLVTDLSGEQARMDVVRTHTPVLDTPPDEMVDGQVIGVLEITRDISADRAAARSGLWTGIGLIAVSAATLFAIVMFFVVRAGRQIDRGYRRLMLKHRRAQKAQSQQTQSAKLAVVGELVASVAHELNNPLTGIWGISQIALKRDPEPKLRRDLEIINQEATRSVKIIQNILSFSRARAAEKAHVSVNAAIEAAVELRKYQLVVNNIVLDVRLDPSLPRTMADPHKLQQVAVNLINNAEQAMLESKGAGRLSVVTQNEGEWIRLTVADTGPGIAQEDLERIFDPFFSTKGDGKGTGLGLSISYSIVEEHGGSIQVESEVGQGTRFDVLLPVLSPTNEGDSDEEDEERGARARRRGPRRHKKPRASVAGGVA